MPRVQPFQAGRHRHFHFVRVHEDWRSVDPDTSLENSAQHSGDGAASLLAFFRALVRDLAPVCRRWIVGPCSARRAVLRTALGRLLGAVSLSLDRAAGRRRRPGRCPVDRRPLADLARADARPRPARWPGPSPPIGRRVSPTRGRGSRAQRGAGVGSPSPEDPGEQRSGSEPAVLMTGNQ